MVGGQWPSPPSFRCADVTEVWGAAWQELVGQSQNRMTWAWDQRAKKQSRVHLAAPFLSPCPSDSTITWEALALHSGVIGEWPPAPQRGTARKQIPGLSRAGSLSSSPLCAHLHPAGPVPTWALALALVNSGQMKKQTNNRMNALWLPFQCLNH